MIETSGERFVGKPRRDVIKIVDVKCPDSGEAGTFQIGNLEAIDRKKEMKFAISIRRDYDFARDFSMRLLLAECVNQGPVLDACCGSCQKVRATANGEKRTNAESDQGRARKRISVF
jgi:hypothetical protein